MNPISTKPTLDALPATFSTNYGPCRPCRKLVALLTAMLACLISLPRPVHLRESSIWVEPVLPIPHRTGPWLFEASAATSVLLASNHFDNTCRPIAGTRNSFEDSGCWMNCFD